MSKDQKSKQKKPDKKEEEEPVFEEFSASGRFVYPNKSVYEGEYRQLKTGQKIREGKGKYTFASFELQLKSPNATGYSHFGRDRDQSPENAATKSIGIEYYDGEWLNDKMDGYGIYHYSNGDVYEGMWVEGRQHGRGRYVFANGNCYEGDWQEHKMHGCGVYSTLDKSGFSGEFREGGYSTDHQPMLKESRRILTILERLGKVPDEFKRSWDEAAAADPKTINEALMPFFANQANMGSFFNNVPFPVFEEQKPKYWTDTIKWIFEEEKEKPGVKKGKEDAPEAPVEKLKIYIPKSCDDCQILAKDALLAPQLQNELDSGQVVEMVATIKER